MADRQSFQDTQRITFSVNGYDDLTADADFDCEYEPYDRQTGYGGCWQVELVALRLGGLELSRTQAADMLGREQMLAIEERVTFDVERAA